MSNLIHKIALEHHIWFDHGHYYKTLGTSVIPFTESTGILPVNYDYDTSNLIYGGLVVRLRFDF